MCCNLLFQHSFPTRRSSDLRMVRVETLAEVAFGMLQGKGFFHECIEGREVFGEGSRGGGQRANPAPRQVAAEIRKPTARFRSEEHTSELQSRQYLVCRLLLE